MRALLAPLLLAGCVSTQPPNPQQIEAAKVVQPSCFFWCIFTSTTTQQQGAKVESTGSGTVSITKPLTETITETVTETTTKTDSHNAQGAQ